MNDYINLGISLISVKKFENRPYERNLNYYKKIFNNDEIEYCKKFKNSYERFAGKYAVKDATVKALDKKIPLKSIITKHQNSKPIVSVINLSNFIFSVSLSHENNYAIAIVLCTNFNY